MHAIFGRSDVQNLQKLSYIAWSKIGPKEAHSAPGGCWGRGVILRNSSVGEGGMQAGHASLLGSVACRLRETPVGVSASLGALLLYAAYSALQPVHSPVKGAVHSREEDP